MSVRNVFFIIALGSIITGACSTQSESPAAEKIRILLDTDANNELDDQHAIAYMLLNGGVFEVEGITVNRTNNGADIDEQAREAERIVELCALSPQLKVHQVHLKKSRTISMPPLLYPFMFSRFTVQEERGSMIW